MFKGFYTKTDLPNNRIISSIVGIMDTRSKTTFPSSSSIIKGTDWNTTAFTNITLFIRFKKNEKKQKRFVENPRRQAKFSFARQHHSSRLPYLFLRCKYNAWLLFSGTMLIFM